MSDTGGNREDLPGVEADAPSPPPPPRPRRRRWQKDRRTYRRRVIAASVLLTLFALLVLTFLSHPLILLGLGMVYGWILFAHLEYRRARRSEVLQLLATAAESGAPLAPALRAYLAERGPIRSSWLVGLPLAFLLPGYYAFLHRPFDELVEELADRLEDGEDLTDALAAVPAVTSREGRLAAEIGHVTGRLGACLRRTIEVEKTAVWVEAAVRAFYTLLLVIAASAVTQFWVQNILPKMERIFHDFGMPMPGVTENFMQWTGVIEWFALDMAVLGLASLLLLNRTCRWYYPVVGRLYRLHLQGRLSRALGLTLEAGLPAPQALALLADSSAFPGPMQERCGSRGCCRRRWCR
jgi:hypothetical protein